MRITPSNEFEAVKVRSLPSQAAEPLTELPSQSAQADFVLLQPRIHSMVKRAARTALIATLLLHLPGFTQAQTPRTHRVDPARLPPPSRSNMRRPRIIGRPARAQLKVPPGFRVSVFAERMNNPRMLALAPNGDIFCVESRPNRVTVLRDSDGDGRAEFRRTFARGLNLPFGIAFHRGYLYVANTGSVVRWPYRAGQTQAAGKREVIIRGIPERGYNQHWTRNIRFDASGKTLYLTVGSWKNVAVEPPPRASVVAYAVSADGRPAGKGRLFATGLRNPVGLDFHPQSGVLWTTVNERDYLGDDLVPDFFTSVRQGDFFGWPHYYIGKNHDPRMPERPDLRRRARVPDILFTAHSAPLGFRFYRGQQFPKAYRGDAFVALHGSTNRSRRTGYKVVRVRFNDQGKPIGGYEDFLTGWMLGETRREVWGRPVGIIEDRHGALLIADDGGNRIWRVTYTGANR